MRVILRNLDLETAGITADHEVVEIGLTDVQLDTETLECVIGETMATLYGVSRPMGADVIAVHHITNGMVADLPVCAREDLLQAVHHVSSIDGEAPTFVVAHNWAFEGQWFTPEILGTVRPICTMKCALRMFPDSPSHGNQALRYFLDLDLDHYAATPPHRAGPDSYVTAHLLARMLQEEAVRSLYGWTLAPRYYATCPLRKHRGQTWETIPGDYLHWIVNKADEVEADIKETASMELERRRGMGR